MNQIQYALRNKKTGLYFRGSCMDSKFPRLYIKRPSITWTSSDWSREKGFHHHPENWEFVKFTLVEVGTEALK